MKTIPLTQGHETLVDDEDYEELSCFKWRAARDDRDGYRVCAIRKTQRVNDQQSTIYMHRVILDAPSDSEVDRINHDTLDNRQSNIRITDRRSNQGNQKLACTNTSGFKGVYWHRQRRRWCAHIWLHGKRKHLGYSAHKALS